MPDQPNPNADADQQMPSGAMNPEGDQMPSGDMSSDQTPEAMPEGGMEEGAGDEPQAAEMQGESVATDSSAAANRARFPPDDPDATPTDGDPEPGVVEVEFREGFAPLVAPSEGGRAAIASSAGASSDALGEILQRRRLERAEPSIRVTSAEAASIHASARANDPSVPNLSNFMTLHFPAGEDTRQIAAELRELPEVERAVVVPRALPPHTALNEPLAGAVDTIVVNPTTGLENQWYIFRCRADRAWNRATGKGVVIADIDWGYRTTHEDLSPRLDMTRAYNAFDDGTDVTTGGSVFHGTGVMGLAGAADNNLGMAGFAFESSLWPVQGDTGPGTPVGGNAWARGIDWVNSADSGCRRKVIILEVQTGSFGNYEMIPSVNAAIRTAIANGVVVCVAAGNGDRDAGIDDSGDPIPPTGSILVGATSYHPTVNPRAGFSNFGPRITVAAPGDSNHDVTCDSASDSAYRNDFGGTSGATPKVAGAAALMLEVNPELTHAEIRDILNQTGGPVVTDAAKPVGTFLNVEAAVQEAARRARPRVSGPVVSWGPNRLDAFALGTDSALYHKWWDCAAWGPSPTGFEHMGGKILSDPEAVSWSSNRLDLFVLGTDRALYHKWWDGSSWGPSLTGFEKMGGKIIRQPKAVSWGPDRLDVFVLGTDSALYHKWWDGSSWGPSLTGYEKMGGKIISDPEAVAWGANRLDIFVLGTNSALYHKWWDGSSWGPSLTGYEYMGGKIIRQPKAVAWGTDRLDIFVLGTDSALYHKWWDGSSWGPSLTAFEHMGGKIISDPEVVSWGPHRLDIFVVGTDSALYHKWWDGSSWGPSLTGYENLGGKIVGQPHAVAWGSNRLDIFALGTDSAMYHKWWDGSAWRPSMTGWEKLGGVITRF